MPGADTGPIFTDVQLLTRLGKELGLGADLSEIYLDPLSRMGGLNRFNSGKSSFQAVIDDAVVLLEFRDDLEDESKNYDATTKSGAKTGFGKGGLSALASELRSIDGLERCASQLWLNRIESVEHASLKVIRNHPGFRRICEYSDIALHNTLFRPPIVKDGLAYWQMRLENSCERESPGPATRGMTEEKDCLSLLYVWSIRNGSSFGIEPFEAALAAVRRRVPDWSSLELTWPGQYAIPKGLRKMTIRVSPHVRPEELMAAYRLARRVCGAVKTRRPANRLLEVGQKWFRSTSEPSIEERNRFASEMPEEEEGARSKYYFEDPRQLPRRMRTLKQDLLHPKWTFPGPLSTRRLFDSIRVRDDS